MPFAELRDLRLHYELSGRSDAPVLVLSNPLGTNLSMWDAQMPGFNEHFRVLRYDTRGFGQSSVTPGPYKIDQLARDLLSLLDSLRIDRVHFCGLSMGGSTGMWLGINAGKRLNKLVLCNTSAKIGTPEVWNPRMEAVRKNGMKAISDGVISRWFTESFRTSSPKPVAATREMLENADPEGYVANCAAIRDFDAREAIANIKLPTLVVAGAHDPSTTAAEGRFIAEKIPGARYVELDAAHLSNIERPDRFTPEVIDFLVK
jgi:3-oxoadipate enol-lactonase